MSTETVEVVFRESGSKSVSDGARNIGTESDKAASSVNTLNTAIGQLSTALAAVGLAVGIKQVLDLSEAYELVINKLRLNASSVEDLTAKEQALYDIALQTRQGFDDVAGSFTGLEKATRGLGLSQKDVLDVTETVAKATTASGKSAEETAGAMKRLGLALQSDHTDARLFMTLFQQFPALGTAIATGLNKSIPVFREMLVTGQITTRDIITGLQAAGAEGSELARRFALTEITVSGAFRNISTAVEVYLGRSTQVSGVTTLLANALNSIATNINIVMPVVIALGVAITVLGAAMLLTSTYASTLLTAIGANKWGLIIAAISAVVSLFLSFGNNIKLTADGSVTALGAVVAAIKLVGAAISGAFSLLVAFYNGVVSGNPYLIALAAALGTVALGFTALGASLAIGTIAGLIGGLIGLTLNFGLLLAAVLPTTIAIGAFIAIVVATTAILAKISDFLHITTGAYDNLGKAVDAAASIIKTKVGSALTESSNQVKAWAGDWKSGADQIDQANSKVVQSTQKMAGDADIALKAYGDAQARAQKLNQSLMQAMGQDTIAAGMVINEAWHHAADDPDAGIKAYMQRQQEAEDAANKMLISLVQRSHQAAQAAEQSSKQQVTANNNVSTSVQNLATQTAESLNAVDGAYTKWATDAEEAADKVIQAQNDAANNARQQSSSGGGGASNAAAGGSFQNFSGAWDILNNKAHVTSADYTFLENANGNNAEVQSLQAKYNAANSDVRAAFDATGITQLLQQKQGASQQFASGGSFTVGGQGGTDSQMVSFMASPDERVTVQTPAQQRASSDASNGSGRQVVVHMHIQTPDVAGFQRTHRQISSALSSKLTRVGLAGG